MDNLLTGLNGGNVPALELIFMITLVALLPSIVVMMTSFTRTIIILSFTRNAMGIQQTPPNLVLAGISLFLTLYIMGPVIGQINETAYQPYLRGELTQEEITEEVFSRHLYTAGQPDPDLIIRPSGEQRISNFLLWQSAYTEYIIMDILWPDFTTADLDAALAEYARRNRRFGGV